MDDIPPSQYNKQLIEMAACGNIEMMQALIDAGADVSYVSTFGKSALHRAALIGHVAAVQLLLKYGADPNIATGSGETPLYEAAYAGKTEAVAALLAVGANPNGAAEYYNPVKVAAEYGYNECLELLLAAGAKVPPSLLDSVLKRGHGKCVKLLIEKCAVSSYGVPVNSMHYAVIVNDTTGLQKMIDSGVDVHQKDRYGYTPLYWAVSCNHAHCAEILVNAGADMADVAPRGGTALGVAAYTGSYECLEVLLAAGANVNEVSVEGKTPLCCAIYNHHSKCAQRLIAAGADVTRPESDGKTLLLYAIRGDDADIMQMLIDAGADINDGGPKGMPPVFQATESESPKCLELLIKSGVDVNIWYEEEVNPLMYAAAEGTLGCVCLLLSAGLDVNAVDKSRGCTALVYAVRQAPVDCVLALLAAGADVNIADNEGKTPLEYAVEEKDVVKVSLLLANPQIDTQKISPLWVAVARHDVAGIQKLIGQGVSPNEKTSMGCTPLQWAVLDFHAETLAALLSAPNVNVNERNVDGDSLLIQAIKEGHPEAVKMLIAAGANVYEVGRYGSTPMSVATDLKRSACVKILQEVMQ